MEITADEFKTLCDDIDTGGMSRELNTHFDIFQIIEFVVSNHKCLPVVIATINKYLAIAEDRNKGFQVLYIVLKHLPITMVEEKAILWSNFAVEFNRVDTNSERFLVLAQLIKICHINQNQEFNRHATGGLLKRIIDKCLSLQGLLKAAVSVHYAMINVLNICLQTYPGCCGHYKAQIETFLLRYLDVPNKKGNIEEAGACLHYLQQAGPAGPNHSNHSNNWKNQVRKLCVTIQDLYDHLFLHDTDHFEFETPDIEPYKFEHMSSCDSINTAMLNGRRLQGLIVFLGEMLSNSYPVEKQVPSKIILDVIQRGLSINMRDENKYMIENINSKWVLQIKLDVLVVFKHWVNIMGKNAKLYHPIILDMLVNTMKTIETPSQIYTEYQLKIYNALSYYIDRVKPTITNKYQEEIIEHLLKLVKPNKNNVKLNIDVSLAGKSAKGKKRSIDQRIIESAKSFKNIQEADADKETRENVGIAAFKALNTLFNAIHVKISERICLNIFDTIIPILNDLYQNIPTIPYDNENCQVELYNFLLKIYNQPFLPRQLPLSLGLMYFGCAQYKDDKSVKVSQACEKALYILEKTCQPICSSLYMPGSYSEERKNAMAEREKGINTQEILAGCWVNRNADVLVRINHVDGIDPKETNEDIHFMDEDVISASNKSVESKDCNNESFDSSLSDDTHLPSPAYSVFSPYPKSLNKKVNVLEETIIPSPIDTEQNAFGNNPLNTYQENGENNVCPKENSPSKILFKGSPKEILSPKTPSKTSPKERVLFKGTFNQSPREDGSPISSVVEMVLNETLPIDITGEDYDSEMQDEDKDRSSIFSGATIIVNNNQQINSERSCTEDDYPNMYEMVGSFIPNPNF